MKGLVLLARTLFLGLLLAGCLAPSESTSPMPPEAVHATQLTPAEWAALSRPGPSHQLLDLFVGEWNTRMTFWSAPDVEPQVSSGSSTSSWVLGQRFIREDFEGQALGEKMQGIGIMGYDNGAGRFINVWIDSLNTAMATATGKYLAKQNRFEFVGEVYDPLLSRMKQTRSYIQILSADQYDFLMFDTGADGREFKALEIKYVRKK